MKKPQIKIEAQQKPQKGSAKYINHEHLDKIGEVAVYYGFIPMRSPTVNPTDIKSAKDLMDGDYIDDDNLSSKRFPLHAEEKIAFLRMYHEQNMHALPQPVMAYFRHACRNSLRKGEPRYADLEILGSSGSIAEATLIQVARSMLAEEKYTNTRVEINSIGDRESIARFTRELTSYYRKHINDMTPECRQILKKDPFELLSSHNPECKELNENAPKSMNFLSESSRRHLEEVLEYLEALDIPYTINNNLISNRKYCTETVFAIINEDETNKKAKDRILALGVRYNGLAKRVGMKKDVQGVGISLLIKNNNASLRKPLKKTKRPIASFVQLSPESKLMSLMIIEMLRKAKIPLYLSLAKDRLGAQVSTVERHHTPYVIVMGKKEALEKTVLVRHRESHSHEVVSLAEIAKHMKKIEMGHFK